jgi:hypothetical protein
MAQRRCHIGRYNLDPARLNGSGAPLFQTSRGAHRPCRSWPERPRWRSPPSAVRTRQYLTIFLIGLSASVLFFLEGVKKLFCTLPNLPMKLNGNILLTDNQALFAKFLQVAGPRSTLLRHATMAGSLGEVDGLAIDGHRPSIPKRSSFASIARAKFGHMADPPTVAPRKPGQQDSAVDSSGPERLSSGALARLVTRARTVPTALPCAK